MEKEVWLPVRGYEGFYECSNLGLVRRDIAAHSTPGTFPGKLVKPSKSPKGYYNLSLSKNGIVKTGRLSRIILEAFCGPPPFENAHAAHNDGNPENNKLTNLRWATPTENQADVNRHGNRCKGEDVHNAVLKEDDVIKIRQRISNGERNKSIANDYGISISTVHLIRHNRIWRHINGNG